MSGVLAAMVGSGYGATITLSAHLFEDATGGAGTATASYTINADGFVYDQALNQYEQWCAPASATGNYECRVTMISGSVSSGTVGSWLALTSSRTWTLSSPVPASTNCEFTAEIRHVGGGVLASANTELVADATP